MLKIRKEGSEYRVELLGVNRFNTLFSERVKDQLKELVEETGMRVVFDLEGISFIDTSGFEVLKGITEHAHIHGSEFELCNVTDDVKELMALLELENKLVFCKCASSREAIPELSA
jgi:anti-anti-sigma factor